MALRLRRLAAGALVAAAAGAVLAAARLPRAALSPLQPGVERRVSDANPAPGDTVVVELVPSGFASYLAVEEALGGLEYEGEHTADHAEGTAFVLLEARPFAYRARVPPSVPPGTRLVVRGTYREDPVARHAIPETVLVVRGGPTPVTPTAPSPATATTGTPASPTTPPPVSAEPPAATIYLPAGVRDEPLGP